MHGWNLVNPGFLGAFTLMMEASKASSMENGSAKEYLRQCRVCGPDWPRLTPIMSDRGLESLLDRFSIFFHGGERSSVPLN